MSGALDAGTAGAAAFGAGLGAAGATGAAGFGWAASETVGVGAAGAEVTGAVLAAGVVAGTCDGVCLLDIKKNAPPPTITTPITAKIIPLPPDLDSLDSVLFDCAELEGRISSCTLTLSFWGCSSLTGVTTVSTTETGSLLDGTRIGDGAGVGIGVGGAEVDATVGLGASAGILVPHLMQNFALSRTSAEQFGHFLVMAIPYFFYL